MASFELLILRIFQFGIRTALKIYLDKGVESAAKAVPSHFNLARVARFCLNKDLF